MSKEKELEKLLKAKGYKSEVINISESKRYVYNPFLEATRDCTTIEEKEAALIELMNMAGDYASSYARQRLTSMDFLNNEPAWKERAIKILNEYASMQ